MAKSKATKKLFNMAYGIGASVVIIGALFKILHWEFMGIGGGTLLAIGLITESLIFFISAFEPVEDEYDWAVVFPELAGGESRGLALGGKSQEDKMIKESLSKKLDGIFEEAKLDANVMKSLKTSIESFSGAAKEIAPVTIAAGSVGKYGEQLSSAAANLESLNALYALQLEKTESQLTAQSSVVEKITLLNDEMLQLKNNIASLNSVYGGMLNAMGGKK